MINKQTRPLAVTNADQVRSYLKKNPELWNLEKFRQEKLSIAKSTRSILILFNKESPFSFVPDFDRRLAGLYELLKPALTVTTTKLNIRGFWSRLMLAELPAGHLIPVHTDKGWHLQSSHRIHWVIETNDNVKVTEGNREFHFGQDSLWELNNIQKHGVKNLGDSTRIHMVGDFVPEPIFPIHFPDPYPKDSEDHHYFQLLQSLQERNREPRFY